MRTCQHSFGNSGRAASENLASRFAVVVSVAEKLLRASAEMTEAFFFFFVLRQRL